MLTILFGMAVPAVFEWLGHALIKDMYDGSSFGFLNGLIRGQANHSVEFYDRLASQLVYRYSMVLVVIGFGFAWFSYLSSAYRRRQLTRRQLLLRFAGAVSVVLMPPVLERTFAVSLLLPDDKHLLWLFSGVVFAAAWIATRYWHRNNVRRFCAVLLPVVMFIGVELAWRGLNGWSPQWRLQMTTLADHSRQSLMRYQASPFLHYTGRRLAKPIHHNHGLSVYHRYNDLGFIGDEFSYQKPPGTIRIVCLGGSTTESGYPAFLSDYLNEQTDRRFEVLNFGLAGWSSGHSVVNFLLNVRDFAPDVCVIHHGWNDGNPVPIGPASPGDHSAMYGKFSPPSWPDAFLVRASTIYRSAKHRIFPVPTYATLERATEPVRLTDPPRSDAQDAEHRMAHFERNLRSIILLADDARCRCVIASMPYSESHNDRLSQRPEIKTNNATAKRVAEETQTVFFDLDLLMTGRDENEFLDLAHMTDSGRRAKAKHIGNAIREMTGKISSDDADDRERIQ